MTALNIDVLVQPSTQLENEVYGRQAGDTGMQTMEINHREFKVKLGVDQSIRNLHIQTTIQPNSSSEKPRERVAVQRYTNQPTSNFGLHYHNSKEKGIATLEVAGNGYKLVALVHHNCLDQLDAFSSSSSNGNHTMTIQCKREARRSSEVYA